MTALIVALLAAVGIGGGVMIASNSGGGGGGGGAAIVETVNQNDSDNLIIGSSSNVGTVSWEDNSSDNSDCTPGFIFNGGSDQTSSNSMTVYLNGNPNLPAITGNLFANVAGSAITTSNRIGLTSTNLNGSNLKVYINLWRPVLISGNNFSISEENPSSYRSWGNHKYVFDYNNYYTVAIFNLGTLVSENNFADIYTLSISPTDIQNLSLNFLRANGNSTSVINTYPHNLKWNLDTNLALGARKLTLQNSDFGYIKWKSYFTGPGASNNPVYTRWGAEQMYWFDTSKQLLASQYNRYASTSNIATFNGNVIGGGHIMNNITGADSVYDITGNINLTLNFNSNARTLNGTLSNMKIGNTSWYNFTLIGSIRNDVNAVNSAKPNFVINSVEYNQDYSNSLGQLQFNLKNSELKSLMDDNSFGHGVIVKGSNNIPDEAVGEIAFVGASQNFEQGNILIYTNLAFGAK